MGEMVDSVSTELLRPDTIW